MATSTIVWIVVIAVAVILLGLLVVSMRRKSLAEDHAEAVDLREQADTRAAGMPDLKAKVDQAEAQAGTARLEAERAEDHATSVRAQAAHQQAIHEDEIRAADRLDPQVDDRDEDYSPQVADPAGPSNLGADNASIAGIGSDTGASTAASTAPDTSSVDAASTDAPSTDAPSTDAPSTDATSTDTTSSTATTEADNGSSVTLEPTDTAPRDTSIGVDHTSLQDRLEGEPPEADWTKGTQTPPGDSGGTHRA